MKHAGITLTKAQWKQYFMDEEKASKNLQDLRAVETKLYKVNDLVIKAWSEYLVSGMKRVGKQFTIQLIQDYGTENAEILVNERYVDDPEKANNVFKRIAEMARY